MGAEFFVIGIGEVESAISMGVGNEGSHADGFGEGRVVGGVDGPGFAEIGGLSDGAAVGFGFVGAVAVISDIEEEGMVGELGNGAFGGIVAGR